MNKIILGLALLSLIFIISCSSSTSSDDPPTITFIQPQNNETINDSIYTIQVSIENNSSTFGIVSTKIFIDSICVVTLADKDNCSYDWHTYWWTESTDHSIRVEAMDGNNNTATKSINVSLSDQAYIVPKLLTPPDNSQQQNPMNFSWTALPQTFQYEIHITINDTPFVNTTTNTTYTNSFLIYGAATWKVKAQNALGMKSKFSEEYHFTLTETKR